MIIYLILHELKRSAQVNSISFSNKEKAIACAAQIASQGYWEGSSGDFCIQHARLNSIIKLDIVTLQVTKCTLALDNGRFTIKEKTH